MHHTNIVFLIMRITKRSSKTIGHTESIICKKNEDVKHQDVKMYVTTNQFTKCICFVPHNIPHSAHRLGKHYHMRFYPKLGHGTYAICWILYECTQCKSTLDKPWKPGVPPHQHPQYEPVKYCIYWPVFDYFNNRDIINFPHKATSSEDIENNNEVVLDGISENMDALVQLGHYCAISKIYTTTMGYYVIKLLS